MMTYSFKSFFVFLLFAGFMLASPAQAQVHEVKQTVFGMDCAPCAYGLEKRFKVQKHGTMESSVVQERPSKPRSSRQKLSSYLALFTSTGTLLCCALPSAIAAIAGGAAVASFVSTFPWLVPLSQHKAWIFLGSGLMILLSAVLIYRPKGKVACTIAGGEGCEVAGRFTKAMFWLSATIYTAGAFFAYGLVPMLRLLDG